VTSDDVLAVIERELALESPEVRRSPALVEDLLDADFREIGVSGRPWTRSEVVQALLAEDSDDPGSIEVTEMEGMLVCDGLVLLTFLSRRDGYRARRSSLWRRSDGAWRVVFHQGTLL
jgi:hypothetical protein